MTISPEIEKLTHNMLFISDSKKADLVMMSAQTLIASVATLSPDEVELILRRMAMCIGVNDPEWKQALATSVIVAVRNFCQ